jgi:hypothetical protein
MAFIGVKYRVYPQFSRLRDFHGGMIDLTNKDFCSHVKRKIDALFGFLYPMMSNCQHIRLQLSSLNDGILQGIIISHYLGLIANKIICLSPRFLNFDF